MTIFTCPKAFSKRYTIEITDAINFTETDWMFHFIEATDQTNLDPYTATDYFVFLKNSITPPSFAIGRPAWDNWTLWNTLQRKPF